MAGFEEGDDGSAARLPHAGTFNANPITMTAGYAAMDLMTKSEFQRVNDLGDAFRQGINEVLELTNTAGEGVGHYSIFTVRVGDVDLVGVRERGRTSQIRGLHRYMLNHGYFMLPGMTGFVSTVMDTSDVDPFCQTLLSGIRELKGEGTA